MLPEKSRTEEIIYDRGQRVEDVQRISDILNRKRKVVSIMSKRRPKKQLHFKNPEGGDRILASLKRGKKLESRKKRNKTRK